MDAFVQNDGGFLALHSTAASIKQVLSFSDIPFEHLILYNSVGLMKLEQTAENNSTFGKFNSPLIIRGETCGDVKYPQNPNF